MKRTRKAGSAAQTQPVANDAKGGRVASRGHLDQPKMQRSRDLAPQIFSQTAEPSKLGPVQQTLVAHVRSVLDCLRSPLAFDALSEADALRIINVISGPEGATSEPIGCTDKRSVATSLRTLADLLERGAVFLMCAHEGNARAMCAAGAQGAAWSNGAWTTQRWLYRSVLPGRSREIAKNISLWLGAHAPERHGPFALHVAGVMEGIDRMLAALLTDRPTPWPEAERADGQQKSQLFDAVTICRTTADALAPLAKRGRRPKDRTALRAWIFDRPFKCPSESGRDLARRIADEYNGPKGPKEPKEHITYSEVERAIKGCARERSGTTVQVIPSQK